MYSPNVPNQLAGTLNASGLTWVQRRVLARNKAEFTLRAGETEQRFDISLHIVKVDCFATVRPTFSHARTADHAS